MNTRARVLALVVLLLLVSAGAYFWNQRPKADATPELNLDYTSATALKGPKENEATLESVVVEEDGTIRLAPQEQAQ